MAGAAISGSSGFVPTAAGTAIGITSAVVNGNQTHNRFSSFGSNFTVFETRPNALLAGGQEIISIGIRDATIVGGEVIPCGSPGGPNCPVSEPSSLPLVGIAMLGLGWVLRRRSA